ncbi:hypothetical protein MLD38_030133 [Melastoma candidum]|uniref:Uncharacterized protein n=1 Tax=Melastoma candidum TaxID=119954 RepID=A0ACB9MKW2_9MYRT|nr:hypothetical protein MLD38_030133 [Melastoma candidum]
MKAKHGFVCVIAVTLLILGGPRVVSAQTCNPLQLSSCASAIMSSTPPSTLCCSKIKEQEPCLCQYMKNPSLKRFISSPNAKKVAAICGTLFPSC